MGKIKEKIKLAMFRFVVKLIIKIYSIRKYFSLNDVYEDIIIAIISLTMLVAVLTKQSDVAYVLAGLLGGYLTKGHIEYRKHKRKEKRGFELPQKRKEG
ncbi:MAG: hypothetical protein QW727_04490 [Candidatus Pacearchaeota archaeon]